MTSWMRQEPRIAQIKGKGHQGLRMIRPGCFWHTLIMGAEQLDGSMAQAAKAAAF